MKATHRAMTPKEKAKELFSSYLYELNEDFENRNLAKICALIAVDTVLWMASHYVTIAYWEEVKQEIQAL